MSLFSRQQREKRQFQQLNDASKARNAGLFGLDVSDIDSDGDEFAAEQAMEVNLTDENYRGYILGLKNLTPRQKAEGYLNLLKSLPNMSDDVKREIHGFVSGGIQIKNGGATPEIPSDLRAQIIVKLIDALPMLPVSLQVFSWYRSLEDAKVLLADDRTMVREALKEFLELHGHNLTQTGAMRKKIGSISGAEGEDAEEDEISGNSRKGTILGLVCQSWL